MENENLAIFVDTETTGEPLWRQPSALPEQPHLVELAAVLVDLGTREIVEQMCCYVRTDGWDIPEEVVAIHGINKEKADAEGIPEAEAIALYLNLWRRAHTRICFNDNFDARILRSAIKRYVGDEVADEHKAGDKLCVMWEAREPCAIPNNGKRAGIKLPTLGEAHEALLGRPLENAHSAMGDCLGAMDIFFNLMDRGHIRPHASHPRIVPDGSAPPPSTSTEIPLGL